MPVSQSDFVRRLVASTDSRRILSACSISYLSAVAAMSTMPTFSMKGKEHSPGGLLTIFTRKLTPLLEKASRGRFGKVKAEQLKAVKADSFGVGFAKDAFTFQVKQLVEQLGFLEGQIV